MDSSTVAFSSNCCLDSAGDLATACFFSGPCLVSMASSGMIVDDSGSWLPQPCSVKAFFLALEKEWSFLIMNHLSLVTADDLCRRYCNQRWSNMKI